MAHYLFPSNWLKDFFKLLEGRCGSNCEPPHSSKKETRKKSTFTMTCVMLFCGIWWWYLCIKYIQACRKRVTARGFLFLCAAAFPILAYSLVFRPSWLVKAALSSQRKGFTMSERETLAQSSQQRTGSHNLRTGLKSKWGSAIIFSCKSIVARTSTRKVTFSTLWWLDKNFILNRSLQINQLR